MKNKDRLGQKLFMGRVSIHIHIWDKLQRKGMEKKPILNVY